MVRPLLDSLVAMALIHTLAPNDMLCARELPAGTPDEVHAALKNVRPGDEIVLSDGVWEDADILFAAEGREGQSITLRPKTPGGVRFSGSSRLRIAGQHLVVDGFQWAGGNTEGHVVAFRGDSRRPARHCRLTNCAILDFSPTDRVADSKWVSLYGQHNRVDHCYFAGKTNLGTTLVVWLADTPNHHQIDHNHFGHRPPLGTNGGETIRIGTSDWSMHDSSTIVERNYFSACNGEAEIISNKSCNNILRYNTFVECEGALTLRHGNAALVDGNFFFGRGKRRTGGIRVIGEDHRIVNNYLDSLEGDGSRSALSLMNGIDDSPLSGYFQVQRATVAFNTIVNCRAGIVIGLGSGNRANLPPTDCRLANNIVVAGEGQSPVLWNDDPVDFTWQGNLVQAYDATKRRIGQGVRYADAGLQRGDDLLWRPAANSPALGSAGGDFAWVKDDIDGQPRRQPLDVGCDQRSDEAVLRRPLTPADVGPPWQGVETRQGLK